MKNTIRTSANDASRRMISVSEIASIDCWRAYRWKRAGLQPVKKFEALFFGNIWDNFIQEYHKPIGKIGDGSFDSRSVDERLSMSLEYAQRFMDNELKRIDSILVDRDIPRPIDWFDSIEEQQQLLLSMAIGYSEQWDTPNLVTRANQFYVQVPILSQRGNRRSTKYWMHGYIDRVVEDLDTSALMIIDDKSTNKLDDDFEESFKYDLQMVLYAWAMRELGYELDLIGIDAAAKKTPKFPELSKTLSDVVNDNGEVIQDFIECEKCQSSGIFDDADCKKCNGSGYEIFLSGSKKGEFKTRKRKKQVLKSLISSSGNLNYTTTAEAFLAATKLYELNNSDYASELDFLWKQNIYDSPFFRRFSLDIDESMMIEAENILRRVAPFLEQIPDVPLRNKFRCGRCQFKNACIERDDRARADLLAELFTTREQRKEYDLQFKQAVAVEEAIPF